MTDLRKAAEMLIKALDDGWVERGDSVVIALRQALAQPEQEPDAWRNAAIRLGEDLYSVGPNGYYDMTAKQWLDWALSVVNIAQPKQEPVAWIGNADLVKGQFVEGRVRRVWWECNTGVGQPLYTEPPRKEWVGLTEGELIDIQNCNRGFWTNAAKIEQLLKDKNT